MADSHGETEIPFMLNVKEAKRFWGNREKKIGKIQDLDLNGQI